jgi:type III secretory pathway component EscV
MVNASPTFLLDLLEGEGKAARNPANGMLCSIVAGQDSAERCKTVEGLTTWGYTEYMLLSLAALLRMNADVFLTVIEAQRTLSRLSEAFPLPLVNLLERFTPTYIVNVLRALVREGVSIRDLRSVMEAMLEINGGLPGVPRGWTVVTPAVARLSRWPVERPEDLSPEQCADTVRTAMKRYITHQFAKAGDVAVLETSESMETRLRECGTPIGDQEREMLRAAVATQLQEGKLTDRPVILTAFDLGRRLREAIEIEFPYVPVLRREELEGGVVWRDHRVMSWPAGQGGSRATHVV